MAPTEDGTDVLGLSIQDLMVYFYADNGLVVLTHLERLQRAFYILASLFDQVGLQTNARKTVSIACQQYYVPSQMSLEAYKWQTTGTGPTFWERQRQRGDFPDCGVEVVAGFLLTHLQSQHGVGLGDHPPPPPLWGGPKLPGLFP